MLMVAHKHTPMLSLAMFFCWMGEPLAGAHVSKSWSHSLPLRQSMSLQCMPPRNSFGCDVSFVSCSLMLMSLPLCTATIMQHRVWRRLTIIMHALNILKKGTTSCAKLLLITPSSWSTVTQMICLLTCLLKPYLPGKLSHTLQLLAFTLSFPDHSFPPCVFTVWGGIALFSFFYSIPSSSLFPPLARQPLLFYSPVR